MSFTDDAAALVEFRDLLVEWGHLYDDSWRSAERAERENALRNELGTRTEHVRALVSAVVPVVPLVDRRNDDELVEPFEAIFSVTWLVPQVVTLINRAIGVYQRGGPQRDPTATRVDLPDLLFVSDAELRTVLDRNVREFRAAFAAEAWTSAIVLAGAIAEGVLYFLLSQHPTEVAAAVPAVLARHPPNRANTFRRPLEEWTLWAYIEVASELNYLAGTTDAMAHSVLREFRNMVHPRKQIRDRLTPSRPAAEGSLVYLRALIADAAAAV